MTKDDNEDETVDDKSENEDDNVDEIRWQWGWHLFLAPPLTFPLVTRAAALFAHNPLKGELDSQKKFVKEKFEKKKIHLVMFSSLHLVSILFTHSAQTGGIRRHA